jgi:AraC-like DNA-binding protein
MIGKDESLFTKIDNLLFDNPGISLYQVSRTIGIDRHMIQHIVSRMTRMSFRNYQKQHKLRQVIRIISNKKTVRVKELAALLDYDSSEAFSRFIKQMTGISSKRLISEVSGGNLLPKMQGN